MVPPLHSIHCVLRLIEREISLKNSFRIFTFVPDASVVSVPLEGPARSHHRHTSNISSHYLSTARSARTRVTHTTHSVHSLEATLPPPASGEMSRPDPNLPFVSR
jgi:hypothetical protein